MAKIAVASTDGTSIDLHFGQANSFRVYEVEGGGYRFLEERNVSGEKADHSGVARLLSDVEVVLVSRIGPGAGAALLAAGIKAFAVTGPVERALAGFARRGKLLQEARPESLQPCASGSDTRACGCRH